MTWFVQATPAPAPRSKDSGRIAVLYAIILVGFALAQLFTFDGFKTLVQDFGLPVGDVWTAALAPLIIVCEVFALPFLLRMPLSPAFRWLSMILGWLVAFVWFGISTWLVLSDASVSTVGFSGTVGELTPGWWAMCVSLALGVLATWSSWGLWPSVRRVPHKK